jgi:hypothetical protein
MAFLDHRDYQLTGADEPVRVFAARVTASFFPLLGAKAAMGRTFTAEENAPGRNQVVIVSDGFWRNRLGSDPNAVGRSVHLNGEPFRIVGVMAPGFSFDYPSVDAAEPTEIYVPFVMSTDYMLRSSPYGNVRRVLVLGDWQTGFPRYRLLRRRRRSRHNWCASIRNCIAGRAANPPGFSMTVVPLREAVAGSQRPLLWLWPQASAYYS